MRRAAVGKLLGLAGLVGVAATGVVLARDERERRAYSPDDVRARLHERAAAASAATDGAEPATAVPSTFSSARAGEGRQYIPPAATRRGRVAQQLRWQLNRLPTLPRRR